MEVTIKSRFREPCAVKAAYPVLTGGLGRRTVKATRPDPTHWECGILERAQETWARDGLGTRSTIERVEIGNSRPKAARACVLLDLWLAMDTTTRQIIAFH